MKTTAIIESLIEQLSDDVASRKIFDLEIAEPDTGAIEAIFETIRQIDLCICTRNLDESWHEVAAQELVAASRLLRDLAQDQSLLYDGRLVLKDKHEAIERNLKAAGSRDGFGQFQDDLAFELQDLRRVCYEVAQREMDVKDWAHRRT